MNELRLREFSPDIKGDHKALSDFLESQGLRFERFDYYAALYAGDELLCGGGGLGPVIKGVAVKEAYRDMGLMNRIVSHLYTRLRRNGERNVFVFTRPCNIALFGSLGFHAVAQTNKVALLESDPNGIADYTRSLRQFRHEEQDSGSGRIAGCDRNAGCVVMNANPFTNGHLHLLREAKAACGLLHVFVLQAERSAVPFAARKSLVEQGVAGLKGVIVHDGGPYIISPATFPTYFLKENTDEAAVQAALDAEVFAAHIAPALSITRRFVGEEPLDPMTNGYNQALRDVLPAKGIELTVIPRLTQNGEPVSASRVRALAQRGEWAAVKALVPEATYEYLNNYYMNSKGVENNG